MTIKVFDNKYYSIYNYITGKYIKTLNFPDEFSVLMNMDESTDVYVIGEYDENTYYKNGKVEKLPLKEFDYLEWDNRKNGWYDPRTEQEIIEQKQNELNIALENVKYKRNEYLAASDWTQFPDSPLSEEKRKEWAVYRQELRDMTENLDPFNPVWPKKPE